MNVILVGTNEALLEGLAQSYASNGFKPHVVATVVEACELAAESAPLIALVQRDIALAAPGDAMSIPLAAGGSLVLYGDGESTGVVSPTLQRAVLAELTLPLERMRMVALSHTVKERSAVVGRTVRREVTPEAVYHPALEAHP